MVSQQSNAKQVENTVTAMPPRGVSLKQAVAELDTLTEDIASLKLTGGQGVLAMIVGYEEYTSQFNGNPYQVCTPRLADGECRRLAIGPVALRGAFARLGPKPGEWVKLKRLADGEKAQRYRLRVLGRQVSDAVPDFGDTKAQPDDEVDDTAAKAADVDDAPATEAEAVIPF